jgi:hypothetical protein
MVEGAEVHFSSIRVIGCGMCKCMCVSLSLERVIWQFVDQRPRCELGLYKEDT